MNGNNKNYSIRPLTDEEREFASDLKNYNYLFFYMKKWRLDQDTWYDILIEPYLNAVKKYHEYESARQYAFSTVLKNMLYSAITAELKKRRAKKRMPEGGLVSLDYMLEGDNPFTKYSIDKWLIDRKINIEQQVVFKELFEDFYNAVASDVIFGKEDKWLLDLILDGYSMKEIIKLYEVRYGKCAPDDWWKTIDYINYSLQGRIRNEFKNIFNI